MTTIRWGVLSTARIATQKVIPAIQGSSSLGTVTAIASRNLARARAAAKTLGIPTALDSYQALLNSQEIDAVYNPLPNHLHVPWSIRALEAGKHVLCEKPVALTAKEAQQLVDAAAQHPHLRIAEAFMYRHHPQWVHTRALVQKGTIGTLRTVHACFTYYNRDPGNIRNQRDIGGGALMDIGCYGVSLSRFLFGAEPQQVCCIMKYDPSFGTDILTSALLDFGGGIATFTCGTQLYRRQYVDIVGERGYIRLNIPFNAPPDKAVHVNSACPGSVTTQHFGPADQYALQADHFARAILEGTTNPTPLHDALSNMRVIDALVQSVRAGGWVSI